MHEINLNDEIHFYNDSFAYAVDMIVIQFRVDLNIEKVMKISIMYDLFSLSSIRRKYLIYKKKLYVLIIFVIKYDYLCKYHTNQRLFTLIIDRWLTSWNRTLMKKYMIIKQINCVD